MSSNNKPWNVVIGENNDGVFVRLVGNVEGVGGRRRVDHRHVATATQRSLQLKILIYFKMN
jgi:hypothetical protein